MKKKDKFILWLFSVIIFITMVGMILLTYDVGSFRESLKTLPETYYNFVENDQDMKILATVIASVLGILAFKGMFFQASTRDKKEDGILLENNNGKLLISMETLENLVKDISKRIEGTESVTSKVRFNEYNMIKVDIDAVVYQDAIIKDVTTKLQNEIKSAIKQASDLEVEQVNVNIKNISNKLSPEAKKLSEKEKKAEKEAEKEAKEDIKEEVKEQKESKEVKTKKTENKTKAKAKGNANKTKKATNKETNKDKK